MMRIMNAFRWLNLTREAGCTHLQLWKLLKEEDREISIMFDDLKRSNAIHKLAAWKHNDIISEERFAEFSDET